MPVYNFSNPTNLAWDATDSAPRIEIQKDDYRSAGRQIWIDNQLAVMYGAP